MLQNSRFHQGFSLIELLIVVAIIGILGSIAYPSYVDSSVKSRRSVAQAELVRLANLQEQFFVDNREYTADMKVFGSSASDSLPTENGYYKINTLLENNNTEYILKATAQGSQLSNDSACSNLTITEVGVKEPAHCWE